MAVLNLKRFSKAAFISSVLSTLLLPSAVLAERVTLAQAYDRMMKGEIEFEILNLEKNVAAELALQRRRALRPRVMLSLETNMISQNVMSSDNESYAEGKNQYSTYRLVLNVLQPVYDPVRWRDMAVGKAQVELTRAKAEQARNELLGQMIDSFITAGQAQAGVERARDVIEARQAFVSILQAQLEAGRADLGMTLRAEGEIYDAEGDLTSAEMEFTEALFGLVRFAGSDVTGVSLSDNRIGLVGSTDLRQSLTSERLLELSPQMQIAQAELDVAQKVLRMTRAGYLPSVNMTVQTEIDNTDGSLFGGGSQIQSSKVGLGIEVPIYQGGVQKSRVQEEKLRVEIAERRLELTRRLVMRQYDALIAAEKRAAQRVSLLLRQGQAASQSLQAIQSEEDAGRVGAEVVLERKLNADVLSREIQVARLQQLRLQMHLYALFGALDVEALSRQLNG